MDGCIFLHCSSLESITFAGTIEQWNAIDFISDWKANAPIKQVICSDGTVSLK